MVRPPHLPPIGNEEAKRKWKMMNRPSISTLFFPKKSVNNNHVMPTFNTRTNYHRQRIYKKTDPLLIVIKKYQNLQDLRS